MRIAALLGVCAFAALIGLAVLGQTEPVLSDLERQQLEEAMDRFPGADDEVRRIAGQIAVGTPLDPEALAEMGLDQINRQYGEITPNADGRPYGHSLLREAVVSQNLEAATLLLATGADPFFNDHEMAFLSVRMKQQNNPPLWWPDFSVGTAFLDLWLSAGGDPNTRNQQFEPNGNLLVAADPMNLEGQMRLLEAGTNGWFGAPVVLGGVARNETWPSFLEMNANVTLTASEKLFRYANAGLLRPGPEAAKEAFLAEYDVGIRNILAGSSGPRRDRLAWGVQKALTEVLPAIDAEPTALMRSILEEDLSSVEAGFFLAPGQIRSQNHPSQYLNQDNQWGSERWDE